MFEERKESVRRVLDDLSQPFLDTRSALTNIGSSSVDGEEKEEEHTVVVESESENGAANGVTHFCFLVHGYHGQPADLLYLRSAMVEVAEKKLLEFKSKKNDTGNDNGTAAESYPSRIVMHSCQSNWRRTSDGVEKGGERILEEILSVIKSTIPAQDENDEPVNITVSLVGNSLGGLYSRYAIARLAELSKGKDGEFLLIDGFIRAHFNIFCTTATPHLGISGHTWVPLPRTAEIGIGKIMGQTGKDIFRISENGTDLIRTMCTCPSYLKPLGSFAKRIAYANAYHTDFVVPTNTAAFLNADSTYPHHLSDGNGVESENNQGTENTSGMFVATFHTRPAKAGSASDATSEAKVKISKQRSRLLSTVSSVPVSLRASCHLLMGLSY